MPTPSSNQRPLVLLAILAGALALRVHAALTTGLVADDATHYVGLATRIESGDWDGALANWTPPLHPFLLSLAHRATGDWVLGGVLLEVAMGMLTVVAVYFTVRETFGSTPAEAAGALAAMHPVLAREIGSLLSDSTALAFLALSLWLGVLAHRRRPVPAAFGSGLAGGLAYLARPEGILAVVALAPWLLAIHLRRSGRRRLAVLAPLALMAGFLATGGPYAAYLSADAGLPLLSRKKFRNQFECLRWGPGLGLSLAIEERDAKGPEEREARAKRLTELARERLGEKSYEGDAGEKVTLTETEDPHRHRLGQHWSPWQSSWEALEELVDAAHPLVFALFLLGLWRPPLDRARRRTFAPLFLGATALNAYVLYRVHQEAGYSSHRHAMGAVLCMLPFAGLGAVALGSFAVSRLGGRLGARTVGGALGVVLAAALLARTLRPQNERRLAERRASEWIAARSGDCEPPAVASCLPRVPFYAGSPIVVLPRDGGWSATLRCLVIENAEYVVVDQERIWSIAFLLELGWLEEAGHEGEGKYRIGIYRTRPPLREQPQMP